MLTWDSHTQAHISMLSKGRYLKFLDVCWTTTILGDKSLSAHMREKGAGYSLLKALNIDYA